MITPEEIDRVRISLHAALSGAWSEDGSEVYEDFPMRVSFAPWTEDVSSQRHQDAAAHGDDSKAKRFQAGDFNSVAEVFSRVPRYRRVVLGEAGAGKTVLVAELQRRLVEAPQPGDPLPVIVSAAAWRPDRQSLIDWLTQQLAADHGWLPVAHARALVARGIVMPILDGLDEMPSSLRPRAIAMINKYHVYRPLIVTSREGEYRDAVRENRVGVKGAVVVAVQPLHLEDIRAYLDAAGGDGWGKVLDEMDANGALAHVLTNPLMLWLARTEYERESPESLTLFGGRRSLENFLLGQFVPSVYSGDSAHAAGGQFRGTTQKAERWLGHLAWGLYQQYRRRQQQVQDDELEAKEDGRRTDTSGAPVLAWWQIGHLAGRWRRLGIAFRTAALCSVAVGLGIWVLKRRGNWRHSGYSGPVNFGDLFLGGPIGRLIRPTTQMLTRLFQEEDRKHQGYGERILHIIGEIFSVILSHFLLTVLAVALFVGIVTVRSSLGASRSPARLRFRAMAVLGVLAECCFRFCMAILLSIFLLYTANWSAASSFFGSRSTWITLLAVFLRGLVGLPESFVSASDTYGDLSPNESLRLDRQADAVFTVSQRSIFAVAVWLICGQPIAAAYIIYAIIATAVELSLGGQQSFSSRSYIDARNFLAARCRIPWRTMTFLADASRRGVLRQVGAVYQFRHDRLLEQVRYWQSAGDQKHWLARRKNRLFELADLAREFAAWRHDETLRQALKAAEGYRQAAQAGLDVLPPGFTEDLEALVGQLRHWSGRLVQVCLRDVLDTYRMLAKADPMAFRAGLAKVLRESASAFGRDEALRLTNEAVNHYRELAQTDPAAFSPALAEAVSDMAGWLRRRPDEQARDALRDLIDTCRTLAETDPATFKPGLAKVLRGSASIFLWDEALRLTTEAVNYYRELAQADPATFLPALAKTAGGLAYRLSRLGRLDEAEAVTRSVAETARNLAHVDPATFLPALAHTLNNLGACLWESKSRREESISARIEACSIYRELAEVDSRRFGRGLAATLDILAFNYNTLRRQKDELAIARDAFDAYHKRATHITEIRRQIAGPASTILMQSRPVAAPGRARSRYYKETLAAARAAVTACGESSESGPAEFLPDLADAVHGLAVELKSAGKRREARLLAEQADRIRDQYRRTVDFMGWKALDGPLARMDYLALRLWKLGELQDAVAAGQISHTLDPASRANAASAARGRGLPTQLLTRLREERKVRWYQNWARHARKGVSGRQQRAAKDPEGRSFLAQAWQNVAAVLAGQSDALDTLAFQRSVSGRSKDALTATRRALKAQEESVAIYREIYSDLPPSRRSALAKSLVNSLDTLVLRLQAAGNSEAATTAASEARGIRQLSLARHQQPRSASRSSPLSDAPDTLRSG